MIATLTGSRPVFFVLTIFALASGRSGTHFLYELLRRNSVRCICRHETYSYFNPSMFGRPIYDCAVGDLDAVRRQVAIKARWIAGQRAAAYAETSHALLKSWYEVATEFFPNARFVHLVRDPLKVAKSEANREEIIHRWHVPFRFARGARGTQFFRWALTGLEPIFRHFEAAKLTRFQWYVLQWIEIENRAIRMLDRFKLRDLCLTLHSPEDLNDPVQVRHLLSFLNLETRDAPLSLGGSRNRTPGAPTLVTNVDRDLATRVIAQLPEQYLSIFHRQPYSQWPWSALLRGAASG